MSSRPRFLFPASAPPIANAPPFFNLFQKKLGVRLLTATSLAKILSMDAKAFPSARIQAILISNNAKV